MNTSLQFLTVVDNAESRDLPSHLSVISESALFSGLSEAERHTFAGSSSRQSLVRGEPLFLQGQPIRDLIVIENGAIKMSQCGPHGEKIILRMTTKGEIPVIPLEGRLSRYTCTAHAIGRCSVLRWDLHFIEWAAAEYPAIRKNIDLLVSNRLRELEDRFWELLTESAACRLARTIVRLANSIGREEPEGVFIPITRDELAKMSGTTMFTASRYIAAWSDAGSIVPGRREAIVVRNPGQLLAMCGDNC